MQALSQKYKHEKVLIVGGHDSANVAKHSSYGFEKSIGIEEYVNSNPDIHPRSTNKKVKLSTIEHQLVQNQKHHNHLEDEPFKAVLVLHDPDDFGRDLQVVMDVLLSDGSPGKEFNLAGPQKVALYMSNPDLLYSGKFPTARFGQGLFKLCIQAAYKEMTGRELELTQFGKPEKVTYEFAEKKLQAIANELGHKYVDKIYAVGDNPKAGMSFILNSHK
jgi:HAD superfamily hydrolase (TIGR01456 family)